MLRRPYCTISFNSTRSRSTAEQTSAPAQASTGGRRATHTAGPVKSSNKIAAPSRLPLGEITNTSRATFKHEDAPAPSTPLSLSLETAAIGSLSVSISSVCLSSLLTEADDGDDTGVTTDAPSLAAAPGSEGWAAEKERARWRKPERGATSCGANATSFSQHLRSRTLPRSRLLSHRGCLFTSASPSRRLRGYSLGTGTGSRSFARDAVLGRRGRHLHHRPRHSDAEQFIRVDGLIRVLHRLDFFHPRGVRAGTGVSTVARSRPLLLVRGLSAYGSLPPIVQRQRTPARLCAYTHTYSLLLPAPYPPRSFPASANISEGRD